jgi:hypothetical protein
MALAHMHTSETGDGIIGLGVPPSERASKRIKLDGSAAVAADASPPHPTNTTNTTTTDADATTSLPPPSTGDQPPQPSQQPPPKKKRVKGPAGGTQNPYAEFSRAAKQKRVKAEKAALVADAVRWQATYPAATSIPIDDEGFAVAFECPVGLNHAGTADAGDAAAAKAFFQEWGFVVFADAITPAECAASRNEIWDTQEATTPGISRDDPTTWGLSVFSFFPSISALQMVAVNTTFVICTTPCRWHTGVVRYPVLHLADGIRVWFGTTPRGG